MKSKDPETLADTKEILSNPATLRIIKKRDRDIRFGRVKAIASVDDLQNESF